MLRALIAAVALAALPSTGSLSLGQIQTEFGGANPISLSEYYKGGAYVKTTDTAPNVPASGPISIGYFRGAAKGPTFTASISPSSAGGTCESAGTTCTAVSGTITCSATNGVGPYSYAWTFVSGTTASISAPSSASTTLSRSAANSFACNDYSGTFRCTVTDAGNGNATATAEVTFSTTHCKL